MYATAYMHNSLVCVRPCGELKHNRGILPTLLLNTRRIILIKFRCKIPSVSKKTMRRFFGILRVTRFRIRHTRSVVIRELHEWITNVRDEKKGRG